MRKLLYLYAQDLPFHTCMKYSSDSFVKVCYLIHCIVLHALHCTVCRAEVSSCSLKQIFESNTKWKIMKYSPKLHSTSGYSETLSYSTIWQSQYLIFAITPIFLFFEYDVRSHWSAHCPRLHSWFQTPIHTTCLTASTMSSSAGL